MGEIALIFERKAGEGGTLFGSVTSMDSPRLCRRRVTRSPAARSLCAMRSGTGEYPVRSSSIAKLFCSSGYGYGRGGRDRGGTDGQKRNRGRKAKAD